MKKNKGTVFGKRHYASDFTFYNGYIQIENYVLESPKIREIPSHLLNGICHNFTIVQETRRPDHFHFEPYTDLTILLDAVDSISGHYLDTAEEKQDVVEQLAMQIVPFLLSNHENIDDKHKEAREKQFDFVSDILSKSSKISSGNKSCFDFNFDCEIFKVPLEDIVVFDGYVNVNTKNIEFIQDVSWDAFCGYLSQNNQLHLLEELGEDKAKKRFEMTKQAVLQERRDYKKIKIKTYITKKSFTEVFTNQLCQSKELSIPFHYSNDEVNDGRYILSQIPVCKLKEIL